MGGDKIGGEEELARPVSGYGGFVPGITAGNVFAHDYQKSLSAARQLTADQNSALGLANPQYKDGTYLRDALKGKEQTVKAGYPEVLRRADRRIAKYGGYVEGIASENVYGKTFCDSQEFQRHENKLDSRGGPAVEPAWWANEGSKLDAKQGKQMVGYGGFTPQIYAENIHGADFAASQRTAELQKAAPKGEILEPDLDAAHRQTVNRAQEDHSQDKNVPGYGGYVPGIYAKGVFGATFEAAQKEAEALVAADDHPRAGQNFDEEAFNIKAEERKTRPVMENKVKMSGYAGFIPNIGSRNICGGNWEEAQLAAKSTGDGIQRATAKVLTGDGPAEALASHTKMNKPENYVNPEKIPGYAGYVPKIYARNIFGQTFKNSQETSHVM